MLTCEFCQKEYSTKSNLTYHVKTNKKCILLRGEIVESKEFFNCEYCDFKTLNKSGEEQDETVIEVVIMNFTKIKNIDVNDYTKELALVV